MIVFEYKGVEVKCDSSDVSELLKKPLKIVELLTAELKKQIDLQFYWKNIYEGVRDYHQGARDILWDYISDKDIEEINRRLEGLDGR
tara:strand:- start:102 stop:362 length:261 start_codon:yes stop_codon:yes gene_type:complete